MNQRSQRIPRRKPGEKKERSQNGSKQPTENSKLGSKLRRITITVSKQFEADAKEMARILGYSEDDFGRVIAEYGWTDHS
jgi:hypothetical protein